MGATILGNFDAATIGHAKHYFNERDIFLDCRGPLYISAKSYWGFGVKVITLSHVISNGEFVQRLVNKPVRVEEYAWITSFSTLHNCVVKHHGIVSIGSVVVNMIVEPYTVVRGNPAVPIARWDIEEKRWIRIAGQTKSGS